MPTYEHKIDLGIDQAVEAERIYQGLTSLMNSDLGIRQGRCYHHPFNEKSSLSNPEPLLNEYVWTFWSEFDNQSRKGIFVEFDTSKPAKLYVRIHPEVLDPSQIQTVLNS
jgi:hypothetical protein